MMRHDFISFILHIEGMEIEKENIMVRGKGKKEVGEEKVRQLIWGIIIGNAYYAMDSAKKNLILIEFKVYDTLIAMIDT